MSVILTSTNRFSNVVKREFKPEDAFCRDVITMNDAAATIQVGAVVGKYIASPTGTAAATVGTGNGVMGTITMTSVPGLDTGVYQLKVVKTVANAGDFELTTPTGRLVGVGAVGTAFSNGGFSFTLADGSTDFVAGDTIAITVAGTTKWKLVEATATDGSQVAAGVVVGDSQGFARDTLLVVSTDTKFVALTRGPAEVSASKLQFGASVTAGALTTAALNQLKAVGIIAETTV